MKRVMWRLVTGSIHEMGGLVVCIRLVGVDKRGGNIPGAPHRPKLLFQVVSMQ